MSLMSLLVNDWLLTVLFAVVCCAVFAVDGCYGFTDVNVFVLNMALLFFRCLFL